MRAGSEGGECCYPQASLLTGWILLERSNEKVAFGSQRDHEPRLPDSHLPQDPANVTHVDLAQLGLAEVQLTTPPPHTAAAVPDPTRTETS